MSDSDHYGGEVPAWVEDSESKEEVYWATKVEEEMKCADRIQNVMSILDSGAHFAVESTKLFMIVSFVIGALLGGTIGYMLGYIGGV